MSRVAVAAVSGGLISGLAWTYYKKHYLGDPPKFDIKIVQKTGPHYEVKAGFATQTAPEAYIHHNISCMEKKGYEGLQNCDEPKKCKYWNRGEYYTLARLWKTVDGKRISVPPTDFIKDCAECNVSTEFCYYTQRDGEFPQKATKTIEWSKCFSENDPTW